ncbi:fungal-specific transcription factor domain-containing protein [Amylocarpus encephaloides]|uniref:Fungal-specific transcription factor domain-containing protein n=1 Tax=Amylocarpus encephaloides TaxID=45428 RepID=A0A9P8C6C7_9HELO|nr:fungal-specific transcription factor domain-containing protein [Amylocarpus encephaloides]
MLKYSCVICSQRKVKCDRQDPCSQCVKSRVTCVANNPGPLRRRKRTKAEIDLHAKLNRYELLLKAHGIDITEDGGTSEMLDQREKVLEKAGTLIAEPGMSKFIDSNLWVGLLAELSESKDDDLYEDLNSGEEDHLTIIEDKSPRDGSGLLFSSGSRSAQVTYLHPPPVQIFRLWQTFMDNVNPLSKIIHTSTLQPQVLMASNNIENISKPLEALLFAIYTCAVVSMTEEDCLGIIGEPRKTLVDRFSLGTEQSLVRLGLLQSCDIVAFQALVLFLLAVRSTYEPHAFWVLCGVALRIAQRMGVHRDSSTFDKKLSVFESEMRRRLWWQVLLLDVRSAQPAGMGPSVLGKIWDTKLPGNYNDSDLSIDMGELPVEHIGSTEMIFCLTTYEFGRYFMEASKGLDWRNNERLWITTLEEILQDKFLKYCDSSVPLHALTAAVAKSVLANKRLSAHHPQKRGKVPREEQQSDGDIAFQNSLAIMGFDSALHSSRGMRRFWWHAKGHFQYDVFVFLLSELRQRRNGPHTELGWQIVQDTYQHHPELVRGKSNELHNAIGNLTLKAWGNRIKRQDLDVVSDLSNPPEYISILRSRQLGRRIKPGWTDTNQPIIADGILPIATLCQPQPAVSETTTMYSTQPHISEFEYQNIDMDDDTTDWNYW